MHLQILFFLRSATQLIPNHKFNTTICVTSEFWIFWIGVFTSADCRSLASRKSCSAVIWIGAGSLFLTYRNQEWLIRVYSIWTSSRHFFFVAIHMFRTSSILPISKVIFILTVLFRPYIAFSLSVLLMPPINYWTHCIMYMNCFIHSKGLGCYEINKYSFWDRKNIFISIY